MKNKFFALFLSLFSFLTIVSPAFAAFSPGLAGGIQANSSGTTTLTNGSASFQTFNTSGGTATCVLPACNTCSGKVIVVELITAGNNLTLQTNQTNADKLDGASSATTLTLNTAGQSIALESDGGNPGNWRVIKPLYIQGSNSTLTYSAGGLTFASTGGTPSLTSGHIFVGNGSNVATDVAPGTGLASSSSGMWAALATPATITSSSANAAIGNIYAIDTTSNNVLINLPDATVAANKGGTIVVYYQTIGASNTLTINPSGSQNINGSNNAIVTSVQGSSYMFICDGAGWQMTSNDLSATLSMVLPSGKILFGNTNKAVPYTVTGDISLAVSVPNVVATIGSQAVTASKIANATITGTQIANDVALGGNPTTTTQSAGNNSTRIATTAYVDASNIGHFGGDGSKGAVSVTSNRAASNTRLQQNCTTYSQSGSAVTDDYYAGSIINATSTVTISGTGSGGIRTNGNGFAGGAVGTAQNAFYNPGGGPSFGWGGLGGSANTCGGGGGGSACANGGDGGNASNTSNGPVGRGGLAYGGNGYREIDGSGGGQGGCGNNTTPSGNGGGAGAGCFIINCVGAFSASPASAGNIISAIGSAGSTPGAVTVHGGGGGGGGAIFVNSQTSITLGANGTANTSGGAGGNGGSSGNTSGGGGGAGSCQVWTSPSNTLTGTQTVAGGAGGTKNASGTNGTAGGNGVSVNNTGVTPNLPWVTLELDMGSMNAIIAMEQVKKAMNPNPGSYILYNHDYADGEHLTFKDKVPVEFMAAYYAKPGEFNSLKMCLLGPDVDPRSLCRAEFFGPNGDKLTGYQEQCSSLVPAEKSEPVCLGDFNNQYGDRS